MDTRERHLRLLIETIEAVNSSLDLQEVLSLVATKVADALRADACFVYLYDERADELVLRATHGTPIDEMSRRPRMRPGEGITGSAAAARAPVMLASQAHLDPRFKNFPNLPEDEYQSILAVPILTRDGTLEGALNARTREPREFSGDEVLQVPEQRDRMRHVGFRRPKLALPSGRDLETLQVLFALARGRGDLRRVKTALRPQLVLGERRDGYGQSQRA